MCKYRVFYSFGPYLFLEQDKSLNKNFFIEMCWKFLIVFFWRCPFTCHPKSSPAKKYSTLFAKQQYTTRKLIRNGVYNQVQIGFTVW